MYNNIASISKQYVMFKTISIIFPSLTTDLSLYLSIILITHSGLKKVQLNNIDQQIRDCIIFLEA